jgi:hypothetical protein
MSLVPRMTMSRVSAALAGVVLVANRENRIPRVITKVTARDTDFCFIGTLHRVKKDVLNHRKV